MNVQTRSAVLIVEDDPALREALCDTLGMADVPVRHAANGEQALRQLADGGIALVVSDVQMQPLDGYALLARIRHAHPHLPVVMMTAHGTIEHAVRAMRDGASDYLVKPFEARQLVTLAQRFLPPQTSGNGPVAADPGSRQLLQLATRVAMSDATVMISGESGTGKEVIARHIHQQSPRGDGPFVAINCAAIPESMLEATLFGHDKGAFTGAGSSRAGKFEQAQGGTLLLDEVSEMALPLQAKLLRVLQEREVERIGGRGSIALDVRVIATTNRQLRDEVSAGRFREDLFYRLHVLPLRLSPLRERRGDILPLTRQLMAGHCRHMQRTPPNLSVAAEAALQAHDWPGNVRELDNLIQRSLILGAGDALDVADLQFEDIGGSTAPTRSAAPAGDLSGIVRRNEDTAILDALERHPRNRRAAASHLGISERTLRYKLARLRADGAVV